MPSRWRISTELPEAGWEFRERQIWNFSESDVAQITIHQNGKTRQIIHNGPNQWSLAPGSQGIIVPAAIEETAHRFGELTAAAWLARNADRMPRNSDSNREIFPSRSNLKTARKTPWISASSGSQTAVAAVTLDGERWAFVFPPVLYQFVLSYLTIPVRTFPDMRNQTGFWRKCRTCFRHLRRLIIFVVLVLICAVVWLNQIGLPDFLKRPLVETLRARGIELEFARLRLSLPARVGGRRRSHWPGGKSRRPGALASTGSIAAGLSARCCTANCKLTGWFCARANWSGRSRRPTHWSWTRFRRDLRFQANDTWSLDNFQADFAGAKLMLSGDIAHASALRDWQIFHGPTTNAAAWQVRWQKFADTLREIHFTGTPQLSLAVNGDARDPRSFRFI